MTITSSSARPTSSSSLAAYKHQEREIGRLMEFVNRFRAKNTKATQAQSKLKQIERMDKVEAPDGEDRKIDFQFPQPQRSGLRVIKLEDIHHAYGENVVYRGMDFQAERGQRIVLVGPNGAGKSTLLKILAGVLTPQAGTRTLGHNVKAGYYSQYRVDMLHPERTVLEEAFDTPQRLTEQFVRTLLGCFLFSGDDVFKKVEVLSGGEKSRLALVKLLLDPPNLLLMDEPTTHLDLSSVDALAYALDQFEGTLIFISHDVYFIRALANHVVHVNAGRLTHYPGGYQYYLDKTKAQSERAGLTSATTDQPSRNTQHATRSLIPNLRRPRHTSIQERSKAPRSRTAPIALPRAQEPAAARSQARKKHSGIGNPPARNRRRTRESRNLRATRPCATAQPRTGRASRGPRQPGVRMGNRSHEAGGVGSQAGDLSWLLTQRRKDSALGSRRSRKSENRNPKSETNSNGRNSEKQEKEQ